MRFIQTRVVYTIACCLLFAGALSAQTGAITGDVRDPADAAVVGASVAITNTVTGTESKTKTTSTGSYTVPQLPVGTYRLVVEVPGFKKSTVENIVVQVDTTGECRCHAGRRRVFGIGDVTAEAPPAQDGNGRAKYRHRHADVNDIAAELRRRRRQFRQHPQPVRIQRAVARSDRNRRDTAQVNGLSCQTPSAFRWKVRTPPARTTRTGPRRCRTPPLMRLRSSRCRPATLPRSSARWAAAFTTSPRNRAPTSSTAAVTNT